MQQEVFILRLLFILSNPVSEMFHVKDSGGKPHLFHFILGFFNTYSCFYIFKTSMFVLGLNSSIKDAMPFSVFVVTLLSLTENIITRESLAIHHHHNNNNNNNNELSLLT